MASEMRDLFAVRDRVAVVTGGYGVLGGSMATALAGAGARVVVLGRNVASAEAKVAQLRDDGGVAMAAIADVTDGDALRRVRTDITNAWGGIDVLVNTAGGNVARARTDATLPFSMPLDAFDEVLRLNLHGTVIPSLVFGEGMAEQGRGSIINISSMASTQALSGVMGYSAAKAAVENFTKWLAVDLARRCGDGLRVNAISPGFFLSTQNRAVLQHPDGTWTPRALSVLAKTPMGRFGDHAELRGALLFLASDASSFVTGTVLPVDGGFSAFSGV
jgi:NAD(P)-dependent dehydrogenase (short-subunit alcohol dehydrogenase family)